PLEVVPLGRLAAGIETRVARDARRVETPQYPAPQVEPLRALQLRGGRTGRRRPVLDLFAQQAGGVRRVQRAWIGFRGRAENELARRTTDRVVRDGDVVAAAVPR